MAELVVTVPADAPPEQVWSALTAWDRQGEWMLGTRVRSLDGAGHAVGNRLEALTGVGRIGLLDKMRITRWDPPRVCEVAHYGRLLKGSGVFEVRPREGGSLVVWIERIDLPLGVLGRLGWPVARPAVRWGVERSLRKFAVWAKDYPV